MIGKPAKDYEMYSDEGNALVAEMVDAVSKIDPDETEQDLYGKLTTQMNAIATFHAEVWDTAVREAIIGTIEARTQRSLSIYF